MSERVPTTRPVNALLEPWSLESWAEPLQWFQSATGSRTPPRLRGSRCDPLSSDLVAKVRRVKGVKKLGVRLGNWLTADQVHALWQALDSKRMKGKRDPALVAVILACGLRRHEAVSLRLDHRQHLPGVHWRGLFSDPHGRCNRADGDRRLRFPRLPARDERSAGVGVS